MVLILLCAVLLGLSKVFVDKTVVAENGNATVSIWIPVILGIVVPVTFGIDSLMTKYAINKRGIPVTEYTFMSFFIASFF